MSNETEEDQLNRINLQALQNRDPYITKILDQAQRVCVYKFLADKRQWVKCKSFVSSFQNSSLFSRRFRNVKISKELYSFTKGKTNVENFSFWLTKLFFEDPVNLDMDLVF